MKSKIKPLNEQVIVITGASSGIGLATASMAAAKGARVALVSRNLEDLKNIKKQIEAAGGKALALGADVANLNELERVRDKVIEEWSVIDTWINDAGHSIYGKLLDLKIEEEKRLFDTNLWGVRNGCHVAVSAFKKHHGTIINLGSEVSARAIPLQGTYAASKHAVKAWVDAFRIELMKEGKNIDVCLIRPTAINTPFAQHALNRLESGTPKLPTPVYDPNLVAAAILKCAEKPQRDVFVGAPSKITEIMEFFMPGFADKQALSSFSSQIGEFIHSKGQESLFHHPKREGDIHGDYPESEEKKISAYTYATTHPLAATAAALTIGAGLGIGISLYNKFQNK